MLIDSGLAQDLTSVGPARCIGLVPKLDGRVIRLANGRLVQLYVMHTIMISSDIINETITPSFVIILQIAAKRYLTDLNREIEAEIELWLRTRQYWMQKSCKNLLSINALEVSKTLPEITIIFHINLPENHNNCLILDKICSTMTSTSLSANCYTILLLRRLIPFHLLGPTNPNLPIASANL